jgi:CheY-like chemotaxis protein
MHESVPPAEYGAEAACLPENGSGMVLVVEDNEMVRNYVVHSLKVCGYTVKDASSGEDALALLDQNGFQPDLLLTDVVMKGMNGKELYEKIRERFIGVHVLYMSGYTRNIITHHGVLDEGTAFIQKPFSAAMLESKVSSLLCRRKKNAGE